MTEKEILKLWKSGLSKNQLSVIYKRRYNQAIKIVRLNPKGRKAKFITNYEALAHVEKIIYKDLKNANKCIDKNIFY